MSLGEAYALLSDVVDAAVGAEEHVVGNERWLFKGRSFASIAGRNDALCAADSQLEKVYGVICLIALNTSFSLTLRRARIR